ncbi:putative 2-hydroxyhepta-2,4-diene-1,7-dioate isomerase [Fusarium avenaceum]|nr:putative 2-hydroxyhepta-2,4-diene-1,7-dioate isomerase [Fusarium avenaceum]
MVSWPIEVSPDSPFPLNNIPFGIFTTPQKIERRAGVAIGDFILDLSSLERTLLNDGCFNRLKRVSEAPVFQDGDLSKFASLPVVTRRAFRNTLIDWLSDKMSPLFDNAARTARIFIPIADATMHLPFKIPAFTDFMCSDVHIENCSRLAGASTPASHYAMPLGYNGRASSLITDGEPIYRPQGIIRNPQDSSISFQPSKRMDYEAELGVFVSQPLPHNAHINADEADDYIFGFVVLNDWSARDIQFTEMNPLGPINGKSFATSISPWVVTLDALEGARCVSSVTDLRDGGLTGARHLRHKDERSTWDLELKVSVFRPKSKSSTPIMTSSSNLRHLRWSPGQMLAHLASSGCGLRTGELFGTGTISSPNDKPSSRTLGCLLELTEGGKKPANQGAEDADALVFLEDGDEVVISAWAKGCSFGLGSLSGQLLAPREDR